MPRSAEITPPRPGSAPLTISSTPARVSESPLPTAPENISELVHQVVHVGIVPQVSTVSLSVTSWRLALPEAIDACQDGTPLCTSRSTMAGEDVTTR